jgi:hypothetical protein
MNPMEISYPGGFETDLRGFLFFLRPLNNEVKITNLQTFGGEDCLAPLRE